MTTRADLEREREALDALLRINRHVPWTAEPALRASIARLDALLSLSDGQCEYLVSYEMGIVACDEMDADLCDESDDAFDGLRPSQTAFAHRTVADLVRRAL